MIRLILLALVILIGLNSCQVKPTPTPKEKPLVDLGTKDIQIILHSEKKVIQQALSVAVPFAPGHLFSPERIRVLDPKGKSIPRRYKELARWPLDGSLRSVLIEFNASLSKGAHRDYRISIFKTKAPTDLPARAYPYGPVKALLTPQYYADSQVIGPQVPTSDNDDFSDWENQLEHEFATMDPPWESYTKSCRPTRAERSYYDSPHALFQRFIRRGDLKSYLRAREEAIWYRAIELAWFENRTVAVFDCVDGWDPDKPLPWSVIRRMTGQGMLDDYLLNGDPEAAEAIRGMGNAFMLNFKALTSGEIMTLMYTERNMGWTLLGLASYYALDRDPAVADALTQLVEICVDWQNQSNTGAFEHDVYLPDPYECTYGPNGGSPFMTAILVDGLVETWKLTGDSRIPPMVIKAAGWYKNHAMNSNGKSFQYLWNCLDRDYNKKTSHHTTFLNLLIVHVFGAAYYFSGDESWIEFGDRMSRHGIQAKGIYAPKQWTQAMRNFGNYLGYRQMRPKQRL